MYSIRSKANRQRRCLRETHTIPMTITVIDRVPLESIQTIEQAVLSKRFTHESIKRLQHAAKKHCFEYIFGQQTHSNEIRLGW